jgi:hypothetical protein
VASLTAQQDAYVAAGKTLSASDQVTLASLKQQHADFINDQVNQWANLYNGIDKDVQGTAASMISTLFTGSGSFHDEAIKGLEDIGAAVVTKFTKQWTDAIASLMSGAITDLLGAKGLGGISSALDSIGTKMASVFASTATNTAGTIGASGSGAIGDLVASGPSAGDTIAGIGSSGAGASAATSAITSTLASTVSAVTGVISAITGIVGIFQQMHEQDSLTSIESNTRVGALYTLAVVQTLQGIHDFDYNSLFPEVSGINSMMQMLLQTVAPMADAVTAAAAASSSVPDYTQYNSDTFGQISSALTDLMTFNWNTLHPDLQIIQTKLDTLNHSVVVGAAGTAGGSTGTFSVNGVSETITKVGDPAPLMVSNAPTAAPTWSDVVNGIASAAPWQSFVDAMNLSTQMVDANIGNIATKLDSGLGNINTGIDTANSWLGTVTAALRNNTPSVSVTVQGNVIGNTDFVNQIAAAVASNLRLQGVPA